MDYYEQKFRESGIIIRMLWRLLVFVIVFTLGLCVITLLSGCKPLQKVVTVPEVHESHHWHTDSVIQMDSVFMDRQTVVRELDSAAMARYGIQLKAAERAWLVETNELKREIERLSALTANTDRERDSIPKPYPVYVEKQLTWYQNAKLKFSEIVIGILFFIIMLVFIYRRRPR